MSNDPADILERRQERDFGCWLCRHSRADREKIACAQRHLIKVEIGAARFPLVGQQCVQFERRRDM